MCLKFHKDHTIPVNNEIFVFGSNLAGIHGAGAAKLAYQQYGAEWGNGVGLQGNSYAIPTKDYNIKTLPLKDIQQYIKQFVKFAIVNKEKYNFFVTRIGCGLAGYKDYQIVPIFVQAGIKNLNNVSLPENWKPYIN